MNTFYTHINKLIIFSILIVVFTNCRKIESYPPEPEIKFENAHFESKVDDLGNIVFIYIPNIYFTDGDGNIGSLQEYFVDGEKIFINTRPCDVNNTHDYYVNLYEKINGEFVKRDFEENYECVDSSQGQKDSLISENINLNVLLKYLEGRGQAKSLVGDIDYEITVPSLLSDTIKFDFQLCDRDNNYSNIVESPIYIVEVPKKP